jgi:hypothetical protein
MKNIYRQLLVLLLCIFPIASSPAQETRPGKSKQFIYVLHLVPRLYFMESDPAVSPWRCNARIREVRSGKIIGIASGDQ